MQSNEKLTQFLSMFWVFCHITFTTFTVTRIFKVQGREMVVILDGRRASDGLAKTEEQAHA